MVEDVYEPLARYRDEFRAKFSRLVRDKFKALTRAAGVDVAANRRVVAEIGRYERRSESLRFRKSLWLTLMVLGFVAGIAAIVWYNFDFHRQHRQYAVLAAVGGFLLGGGMVPLFQSVSASLEELLGRIERRKQLAWNQLAALNRLYTWDMAVKLIEATVPRLAFDPYFTAQRLADLERIYGWNGAFNNDKSMLFAQSGVINGNPFVFGDYMDMQWGSETYEGTLFITWTEWEEDSEGHSHPVSRSETLVARVSAPKPEYRTEKFLIYGNDAAPNLEFTRRPSELSGAEDGFLKRWRMRRQIKKLQDFSRKLDDEYNYTLMGNHEFEALFQTKDRTNEVEYRLLFTPVAQLQMLMLLKDRQVGYGDDFTFLKRRRINYIHAEHLSKMTLDTDPSQFFDWDWDRAGRRFIEFNESYFRNVYFALAPLLAIPLYQQTRNHEDIWKGVIEPGSRASFWELEALANYHGEEKFRHPSCITHSLLKTRVVSREDGVSKVAVTAYGYRGEKRVTYKSVYGGDGNWHEVPVEWIEYLPVERTSNVSVAEGDERYSSRAAAFRRSIYSWLKG